MTLNITTSLHPPAVDSTTKRSWAKVAQPTKETRVRATSSPTDQPISSSHRVETTRPASKSPSPDYDFLPPVDISFEDPPQFLREPLQVFSEQTCKRFSQHSKLQLETHSEPPQVGRYPDPYHVEIFLDSRLCPPQAQKELEETLKMTLQERYVLPDGDYWTYEGTSVFRFTVYPYVKTLAQVSRSRRPFRQDLVWGADRMRLTQLAYALSHAHINLFPVGRGPTRAPSGFPREARDASPLPFLREPSSGPHSAYQNLVQPAVKHLVSQSKKKRAKLPDDYRKRQNLVQQKHDKVLAMLHQWLLSESDEKKVYLRGDNVAFIQVKCPRALHAVDSFLERILDDEEIEIECCTAPLSRKKQGQLKGFLLYLTCKTASQVSRILELFKKDFGDSRLKCKVARFHDDNSEASETSI